MEALAPQPAQIPLWEIPANDSPDIDLDSFDHIILAFSGGKDSQACVLDLLERGADKSKMELWHHAVDGNPEDNDWFRSLRDQCAAAEVPFLFKQWGDWLPGELEHTGEGNFAFPDTEHDPSAEEWEFKAKYDQVEGRGMLRVGKKRAGRMLDGCSHDQHPNQGTPPCRRY